MNVAVSIPVESEFQAGDREARILLPDGLESDPPAEALPILYLLPVDEGNMWWQDGKVYRGTNAQPPWTDAVYGDPLYSVSQLTEWKNNKIIAVNPSYHVPPWYGNHPTDVLQQQTKHLTKCVVPAVRDYLKSKHWNVSEDPMDRMLMGFSKSGWGAASLLLRRPDFFGVAAAWDSPWFLKEQIWGLEYNFGTKDDELKKFLSCCPDLLVSTDGVRDRLGNHARLVVGGACVFLEDAWAFRQLLELRQFPHDFYYEKYEKSSKDWIHAWNVKWMSPLLSRLLEARKKNIDASAP